MTLPLPNAFETRLYHLPILIIPGSRLATLQASVTTVNGQLGASDVSRSVRTEEDDGALEVGRVAHAAHGDTVEPFVPELSVGVENDFGQVGKGVAGTIILAFALMPHRSLRHCPHTQSVGMRRTRCS